MSSLFRPGEEKFSSTQKKKILTFFLNTKTVNNTNSCGLLLNKLKNLHSFQQNSVSTIKKPLMKVIIEMESLRVWG